MVLGQIASNILGTDVFSSLTSLNTSYLDLSSITVQTGTVITNLHNLIKDTTGSYKKAQINDITDETSLILLKKISQPTSYSCSSSGFSSDSWIPSITQNPTYVPCRVNSGLNSNSSTCTSSADFSSRASGCTGCMETYDLFKSNLSAATVKTSLDTRYTDPSCSTFNSELSNVWTNFYKKKLDVIGLT